MKTLLLILLPIVALSQNKMIVVTEVMYKNKQHLEFNQSNHFEIEYSNGDKCQIKPFQKESYYDYDSQKGTELVLFLEPSKMNKDSQFVLTVILNGELEYSAIKAKGRIPLVINCSDYITLKKNEVFKSTTPLLIAGPETFSLVTMLNSIHKALDRSNNQDNNFSKTIQQVNRYDDRDELRANVSFEQLMSFYHLNDYLSQYVSENSFFREEIQKLTDSIKNKRLQLENSSDDNSTKNQEIYRELMTATTIHEESLKMFNRMNELYLKSKFIIYNRSN